jgi:uncharacterized protein
MSTKIEEHLLNPGPKNILALDGGGTRGIIELAFLARIEALLTPAGQTSFALSDHFDLIGGTSTGSIIAACLAMGKRVKDITSLYFQLGPAVFRPRRLSVPFLAARFDAQRLARLLDTTFGSCRLDDPVLQTGFAAMTRRFDTGSPWMISNNPRAPYWEDPPDGSFVGNRHYKLADVVRASAAAPGYFAPLLLEIAPGVRRLFVDGGLSPYNNPSLDLLMLTQAKAFGLGWKMGPGNLGLVSIGTGHARTALRNLPRTAPGLLLRTLADTLSDGQQLALTLLQWFSESPAPWRINSEIGNLSGEVFGGSPLFCFQRYDMPLEADWLQQNLGLDLSPARLAALQRIDRPDRMQELYAMAEQAAELQVHREHLQS